MIGKKRGDFSHHRTVKKGLEVDIQNCFAKSLASNNAAIRSSTKNPQLHHVGFLTYTKSRTPKMGSWTKNWMGPNPNGPCSVRCVRAIRYLGFFGVPSVAGLWCLPPGAAGELNPPCDEARNETIMKTSIFRWWMEGFWVNQRSGISMDVWGSGNSWWYMISYIT